MRHETIVKTYLKYDELSEAQKLKVIEKMSDINTGYNWYEAVYEDAKRLLGLIGFTDVKIQFSGFWSQGDGASFTGVFKVPKNKQDLKDRVKAFKDHESCYDFADMAFTQDEIDAETLLIERISSRYSHSNTVASDNSDLTHFVRDFSNWIYRSLENECDHLRSRESIEETIKCNDYEFDSETLGIV